MTPDEIRDRVKKLDATSNDDCNQAWEQLPALGPALVPYFLEAYRSFRKARGRLELVFHSIQHARTSEEAYQLGIIALSDKATLVRYRACMLLAFSQRREAVPHLELLLGHDDKRTAEDAAAAIDAISNQNHNYFIDRDHTGRMLWHVNTGGTLPKL